MEEKHKLKHLLEHWIEHNEDHASEFQEWADKAQKSGEAAVHEDIMQAVGQLKKANEFLTAASEKLGEH